MAIGTLLGTIIGGAIAAVIFVAVVQPVLVWIGVRWFGWEYIDKHGVYHAQRPPDHR